MEDHGGGMDVQFDDYDDQGGGGDGGAETSPNFSETVQKVPQGGSEAHGGVKEEPEDTAELSVKEEESEPTQQKISLTHTTKKLKKSAAAVAKEKAAEAAAKAQEGVMPLFKSDPGAQMYGDMTSGLPASEDKDKDITSVQGSTTLERAWWCMSSSSAEGDSISTATTAEPQEYVPMYWTDATETNGIIYLFGRVAVVEPGLPKRFTSCCVAVHGSERNLFVLPKKTEGFKPDGTPMRAGLDKVYADVNKLLVPHVIPRSKGQGFRCKQVMRKYAFEHEEIPRENCEYLKVVYSAKHGTPSPSQCDSPPTGSSIEKIFGATSSALELFLLKRRLMGPSWILVKRPVVMTDSVSWCKLELAIDVSRLETYSAVQCSPVQCNVVQWNNNSGGSSSSNNRIVDVRQYCSSSDTSSPFLLT